MQEFIQCVRTEVRYLVSRILRIEPMAGSGPQYRAIIADKESEYGQAFLYSVDDLLATYFPRDTGAEGHRR